MLLQDEISTGLDSSTTFQIVRNLRDVCHLLGATILVALLQPAPEVYDLFDDVMLLAEGGLFLPAHMLNCALPAFVSQVSSLAVLLVNGMQLLWEGQGLIHASVGHMVYHGPCDQVMGFFRTKGFDLPERKGIPDFLQEVTGRSDQQVPAHDVLCCDVLDPSTNHRARTCLC